MPYEDHLPPRKLPKQDVDRLILVGERWLRAARGMEQWSKNAKECVDFLEGRQWTEEQIAKLTAQGRPALKFNKINPYFRLVMGYFSNNKTEPKFIPGNDEISSGETAEVLNQVYKQVAANTGMGWVDGEVFQDGLTTGRGFYNFRIDYSENDLGEIKVRAQDPFSTYLDPDADSYDLNDHAFVQTSAWVSLDEIEATYGEEVNTLVANLTRGDGYSQFPQTYVYANDETTPLRKFGGENSDNPEAWHLFHESWSDFIDTARRNLRLIETQAWETRIKPVFIDLETGDWSVIPDHWDREAIGKALYHAERVGAPMRAMRRPVKRVRWTTTVGDLIVYDDWGPYDKFSLLGYFPYFRRGQARGMIEDLIDPQKEVNKRRSAEIDIVGRTTNSGWMHHENALDPVQEANLDRFGSAPGIRIKWKGEPNQKPERINPSPPPTSMERLEKAATQDIREISGINESAMGQDNRVKSGRALESQQRQAVIALQLYLDNYKRTTELKGQKVANLIQKNYTEERIIRTVGEESETIKIVINQQVTDPESGTVLDTINNVTVGKYTVAVDEVPMSASFKNAQFEEALLMVEKLGPFAEALGGDIVAPLVEMSSFPESVKKKVRAKLEASTALAGGGVPMTGGAPPAPPAASNVLPFPG